MGKIGFREALLQNYHPSDQWSLSEKRSISEGVLDIQKRNQTRHKNLVLHKEDDDEWIQ